MRTGRTGLAYARFGALLLLLFVVAPRAALADDWADQVRRAEKARKSHDVVAWDQALTGLRTLDHPAAVVLIARFFADQETYEGEWQNEHGRTMLRPTAEDREGFYASLLRGRTNVRSLRAMVEGADDPKRIEASVLARALEDNVALHLVEDHIRSRFQRALRKGQTDVAQRHFALLRDRLHMGDVSWVEKAITDARGDADLRIALLEALPAYAMWGRVLALDAAKLQLDGESLRALVVRHLAPLDPAAELTALVARVEADADRIDGLLDAPDGEASALDELLSSMPPAHVWPALHAVYQRRWQALLSEGPLEELPALHEAFVKIRYARAKRRDTYRYKQRQQQKWDRRIDDKRIAARAPSIDFSDPQVAGQIAVLEALRQRLDVAAPESAQRVAAPYHPDLLRLNTGRVCDADEIAFTHAERAWQKVRDEVLEFNERVRGPTPPERENAALVNAYRLEYDELPLRIDLDLTAAARTHSVYQRSVGQIAHTFPGGREPAGSTPAQRMIDAGYPRRFAGGENVAMGTLDPADVFRWWRGSASHRRNMLAPWWTEIGVGQSGLFWTQNFGSEPYDQDHDDDEGR